MNFTFSYKDNFMLYTHVYTLGDVSVIYKIKHPIASGVCAPRSPAAEIYYCA